MTRNCKEATSTTLLVKFSIIVVHFCFQNAGSQSISAFSLYLFFNNQYLYKLTPVSSVTGASYHPVVDGGAGDHRLRHAGGHRLCHRVQPSLLQQVNRHTSMCKCTLEGEGHAVDCSLQVFHQMQ